MDLDAFLDKKSKKFGGGKKKPKASELSEKERVELGMDVFFGIKVPATDSSNVNKTDGDNSGANEGGAFDSDSAAATQETAQSTGPSGRVPEEGALKCPLAEDGGSEDNVTDSTIAAVQVVKGVDKKAKGWDAVKVTSGSVGDLLAKVAETQKHQKFVARGKGDATGSLAREALISATKLPSLDDLMDGGNTSEKELSSDALRGSGYSLDELDAHPINNSSEAYKPPTDKPSAGAYKPPTDKPSAGAYKPPTDKPSAGAYQPPTDKPSAGAYKPPTDKPSAGAYKPPTDKPSAGAYKPPTDKPSAGAYKPPTDKPSAGAYKPPTDKPSAGAYKPPTDKPSAGAYKPPTDKPSAGAYQPPTDKPSAGAYKPPTDKPSAGAYQPPTDKPSAGAYKPPTDKPSAGAYQPPTDKPSAGAYKPPTDRPSAGAYVPPANRMCNSASKSSS